MASPPRPCRGRRSGPRGRIPRGRAASWFFNLAGLHPDSPFLGQLHYHRRQLDAIAAGHLRLLVTGPAELHAEVPAEYAVTTSTVAGDPLQAKVEMVLYGPDGKRLLDKSDATDEQGQLLATVPPDLASAGRLPCQAQLRVAATRGAKHEEANLPLALCPVRWLTRLWLDQPQYRPGQTVRYRSVTLSQFGLAADHALGVRFRSAIRTAESCLTRRRKGHGAGGGLGSVSPAGAPAPRAFIPWWPEVSTAAFPTSRGLSGSTTGRGPEQFEKELRFASGRFAAGDTVRADLSVQRRRRPAGRGPGPAAGCHRRRPNRLPEQRPNRRRGKAPYRVPPPQETSAATRPAVCDD